MLPPTPDDVLSYWRWYCECVLWPAAPRRFAECWRRIESCDALILLAESAAYDLRFRHALLFYIIETLHTARWRPVLYAPHGEVAPRRVGRPASGRELTLAVLDLLVNAVMGPVPRPTARGVRPRHWLVTATIAAEVFGWTSDRVALRNRVNRFLRKNRPLVHAEFMRVGERALYLASAKFRASLTPV
jgi:hypothetical protein